MYVVEVSTSLRRMVLAGEISTVRVDTKELLTLRSFRTRLSGSFQ
jgi:hypothetical protein